MRKILIAAALVCALAAAAHAEPLRILFMTKSAGFGHSVVQRKDGELGLAERTVTRVAEYLGAEINCSKDGSLISAEGLKDYDVVIFYTSGKLTTEGKLGEPAIPADGVEQLKAWIEAGGGFIGYHSATDTLRVPEGPATPYIQLIGGEFLTHGAQFEGKVKVVDSTHPTMASIPQGWLFREEWYMFHKMNADTMHVLALLEIGEERKKQELYNVPDYPIIWCASIGEGRLHYSAMGHNDSVWQDINFQKSILDTIQWAAGEGPTQAAPNAKDVCDLETIEGSASRVREVQMQQFHRAVAEAANRVEGWWNPDEPASNQEEDTEAWGNRGQLYGRRAWMDVPPQLEPYLKKQ